ncbi:hypothetical protein PG994_005751 [Apiospora phragmitis]|uniref:Xylanolytic transcriptional activator regulatory domain-containing protein n=1 Tax=Apiospora phragmitis TaxID=2905665 RepID=A0ABR1VD50_9PEZI
MTKLVCSNCQLYKVRCTTTLIRRRAMAPKLKPADVPPPERDYESHTSNNNNESLEARLKGIEARLDCLGASSGDISLESLLGYPPIINPHDFSTNVNLISIPETFVSSSSNASSVVGGSFPELPPLHEALPVIETYFREFNSALPLHHEPTFMKLLHRCYSGGPEQQQRQRVDFTLVHSILAIGYRLRPDVGEHEVANNMDTTVPPYPFAEDKSQQCLRNCERLLQELVTRDEDTLGIQVLLALVVLHLADGDERSGSMLISAAMRLAHSLQMHTRASDTSFSLREAQQRHNIFWICYCFDKRIPENNMFSIMEEPQPFHYLRARVQLAFVEGQIYDSLYSVRSLRETPEQRRQQVARLDALLDTWRRRSGLPPPPPVRQENQFVTGDTLLADVATTNTATSLNHTYLLCLFNLHGLYSWDSVWVQNIDVLGRTALENFSNKSENCMHRLQPPIPDAWNKCVLASRRSVQLILSGRRGERQQTNDQNNNTTLLGFSACLLFSALVILLVNITYEPGHAQASQDRQLAAEGDTLLKSILNKKGDTSSKGLAPVLRGLELAADKWTGYYELDPLSIRPPLPATAHDLFGNGILTMAASSSAFLQDDAASTESWVDAPVAFNDPNAFWTEKARLDTSSMEF